MKALESRKAKRPRRDSPDTEPPTGRGQAEARIAQLTGRINQLQDELEERDSLITDMRTTWKEQVDSVKTTSAQEVTRVAQSYQERDEFRSVGMVDANGLVDEVGAAALRAVHATLPETLRAKVTPVAYWRDHVSEVKKAREKGTEEPATHRALLPYLPPAETQEERKETRQERQETRNPDATTRRPESSTLAKRQEAAVNNAKTFKEAVAELKKLEQTG